MKRLEQPDGLDGYIVLVEETDIDRPLEQTEVQGEWVDIISRGERIVLKGGPLQFSQHQVFATDHVGNGMTGVNKRNQ